MATVSRFLSKVRKTKSCWVWEAAIGNSGYGAFSISTARTGVPAHRAAYELFVGDIPKGMQVDHLCRNRACVNPEHLELVTPRENTMRSPFAIASINAKKTHCKWGHEFSGTNIYRRIDEPSSRQCRTCLNESSRLAKLQPKGAVA